MVTVKVKNEQQAVSASANRRMREGSVPPPMADSPIRVAARRQGGSVLLEVEDEGAGIPIADRERIFQKFVRGADAKRAGVRGVGIGLALVQRIVEAHGGTVRLESEPGHGSTFTLVLPCPGF